VASNDFEIRIHSSSAKPEKAPREPYQKPHLGVIDLTTPEVLGLGCKTSGGSGAAGTCNVTCATLGS
jgi:hypothetical protein